MAHVLLLWHHGDAELNHLADRARWMAPPNKLITPGGGLLSARPLEMAASEFGDKSADADFRAVSIAVRDTQSPSPEGFNRSMRSHRPTPYGRNSKSRRDIKGDGRFADRDLQGLMNTRWAIRATLEAYVFRAAFEVGATKRPPMTTHHERIRFIASMDKGRFSRFLDSRRMKTGFERPLPQLAEHDPFASACYWGGFNSSPGSGLSNTPVAFCGRQFCCRTPNSTYRTRTNRLGTLKEVKCHPRHAKRLIGLRLLMGVVRFQISPPETKYPNLAVQVDGALVFPLEGETYCTGIEVRQLLNSGQLIVHKVVRQMSSKVMRRFAEHLKAMIHERNTAKRAGDTLGDGYKLFLQRSLRKVTQALKMKRSCGRATRNGPNESVPRLAVTALVEPG